MERIEISLDQFSQEEINLANANFTTSDLIKFKNKNSVFFRKNNKFINICQKYGVKTILILQYVISIAFKKAQKHNNPFCIKYQTINEHLTEEYKCSYQYISCCIKLLIEEGIITRSRQSKNYWLMQLTPIGYEWIYGFPIGSNRSLRRKQERPKYFIYEWFKSKFRIFNKFNFNIKLKNKLELIKKVMLGIPLYKKDKDYLERVNNDFNDEFFDDDWPPDNHETIKTNQGELTIEEIFADWDEEDLKFFK